MFLLIEQLGDIANQKHQEEQEQKEKLKKESNKRQKNLKTAKVIGKTDKHGLDIDDIPSSEDSYSDEGYN